MRDDFYSLLMPYLDGELRGARLTLLESHLKTCETCRKRLHELRQISGMLHDLPIPDFMPPDKFVSNLVLKLPRRDPNDLRSRLASPAWWLVPAVLLGTWIFIQTLFVLSAAFSLAQSSGVLGQTVHWLGAGDQTAWFAALTGFFGGLGNGAQPVLSILNNLDLSVVNLLEGFLVQTLIAILYCAWITIWWSGRRPQPLSAGRR